MHKRMSPKTITFDWNHARAFLTTAEQGSLSAAARVLGLTQPTLSRQVAALEAELGVTLFERVAQGLKLTEAGLQLMENVRAMGAAANELSLRASGQSQRIEGTVCISATEFDALFLLPAILKKLQQQEPGIKVDVVVSSGVSDLKRREADIALRSFRPTQPDLIVKKLRDDPVWLYGTKSYVASLGQPATPASVQGLQLVAYERGESNLALLKQKGFNLTLDNIGPATQSYFLQWHLVKAGLGLGVFSQRFGDAEPEFVKAFEAFGPLIEVPLWLVCHRELHTSLRIRRVFDALAEALAVF